MTTLDTHKTVRADGSRVVYGARLVHKSDSTEWRYRGIHSVPVTERGTGMILAQRAGTADDPKRFPGTVFGVRVVPIEPDVEDIAHGGSPFEASDRERDDPVDAFAETARALREYERPTSADDYAKKLHDLITTMWGPRALVVNGPVVTHVTDEVVYVIEVHTVKNGTV